MDDDRGAQGCADVGEEITGHCWSGENRREVGAFWRRPWAEPFGQGVGLGQGVVRSARALDGYGWGVE
jgi:hypothetical protein